MGRHEGEFLGQVPRVETDQRSVEREKTTSADEGIHSAKRVSGGWPNPRSVAVEESAAFVIDYPNVVLGTRVIALDANA